MGLDRPKTKKDCAGEGQQQSCVLNWTVFKSFTDHLRLKYNSLLLVYVRNLSDSNKNQQIGSLSARRARKSSPPPSEISVDLSVQCRSERRAGASQPCVVRHGSGLFSARPETYSGCSMAHANRWSPCSGRARGEYSRKHLQHHYLLPVLLM
jgi:hypothetical protein